MHIIIMLDIIISSIPYIKGRSEYLILQTEIIFNEERVHFT
jgi:hypothetical protein